MVEAMMFFALGALAAGVFALLILPLVHARAVRLAARRLQANIPVSLAQIRADKDLLRAEFAMAAWRFETTIEQLKARMAGQLAELGRKADEISRLKLQLGEKAMSAPQARHRVAQRLLIRLADLARLNPALDKSPLVPGLDEIASGERFSPADLEPAGPPDAPGRE
jgi:hypothetical protein